jgi:hypothetical protein
MGGPLKISNRRRYSTDRFRQEPHGRCGVVSAWNVNKAESDRGSTALQEF